MSDRDIPLGFVEYLCFDMPIGEYAIERIFVDERLRDNLIVKESASKVKTIYEKYAAQQEYIDKLNTKLRNTFLDIEKSELLTKIEQATSELNRIRNVINEKVSPFTWKYINYNGEDCLFLGEFV